MFVVGKYRIDLEIELVDNRNGRISGFANPSHTAGLIAGEKFAEGRNV